MKATPRMGIMIVNCENSDFCSYTWDAKDCYFDIAGESNYKCHYNLFVKYCENCIDNTFVYNSQQCYESIFCYECFDLQYCEYAETCNNCFYCYDIKSCSECILCTNLRWKKYHIFNKEYPKDQYEQIKKNLLENRDKALWEFLKAKQWAVHRDMYNIQSENCTGNNIHNSKACHNCYNIKECEECDYLFDVLHAKHCQDMNYSLYDPEWSYEMMSTLSMKSSAFCTGGTTYSRNMFYVDQCHNSEDCFWCIALNHGKNCILNKAYSEAEYQQNVAKLIDHMTATWEWGEFFPIWLSPHAYNETIAQEYMPLSEELGIRNQELEALWARWKQDELPPWQGHRLWGKLSEVSSGSKRGRSEAEGGFSSYQPLPISQYKEQNVWPETAQKNIDECLAWVLICETTWRQFKLIKPELAFYIQNQVPLPSTCPDARHLERMSRRNKRSLHDRTCDKCWVEVHSTYEQSREEKVYCENCYEKVIY